MSSADVSVWKSYSYLEDTGRGYGRLAHWTFMVVLLQHIVDEAEIISLSSVRVELLVRVRVELFVSGRYGRLAHWTFMVVLLKQHIVDLEAEITAFELV